MKKMLFVTPPWQVYPVCWEQDLIDIKSKLKYKKIVCSETFDGDEPRLFKLYFKNPDNPFTIHAGECLVIDPWGKLMIRTEDAVKEMFKGSIKCE